MKTVLITGVAGNVGSALANGLLKDGSYSVVGVDNLSTGSREKLPRQHANFSFIQADVNEYNDISAIFHANQFDYVFHFAAVVGVQRTLANPLVVLQDVDGIRNILSLAKNCGISRVFYSSSSEVYGESIMLPQHEERTPLNSRLPYAIVKNIGEAYFRSYQEEHNLPYTIFRLFNTYGPNQSEDFVVPRFVRAALRNEPITIYGNGMQTRTFLYVDDNIDTILACLKKDLFINDVLNVGSDVECSISELASLILRATGTSSKVVHLPPLPEGDMSRRYPDITRMRSVLNRDLISIEEGVRRLIDHYKS